MPDDAEPIGSARSDAKKRRMRVRIWAFTPATDHAVQSVCPSDEGRPHSNSFGVAVLDCVGRQEMQNGEATARLRPRKYRSDPATRCGLIKGCPVKVAVSAIRDLHLN